MEHELTELPLPEPAYPTSTTGGSFDHQQMRAYAAIVVATERVAHARVLAFQQASYEREIKADVEIEREACAKACDQLVFALDHGGNKYRREAPASVCAVAIRTRSNLKI